MIDEKTDQPKPLGRLIGAFDDLEHIGIDDRESVPFCMSQRSPRLRKLACPLRPITRWSWIEMPSASATFLISFVSSMSSRDGLGSPLGWLYTNIARNASR